MIKIWYLFVHEIALGISDMGMLLRSNWLFERGGNLELWADDKLYELEWMKHPMSDKTVEDISEAFLKYPMEWEGEL